MSIPETGFMRLREVLAVIPVGKTVWYEGIKTGKYPKGHKLSARATGWKAEDIRALVASIGGGNEG